MAFFWNLAGAAGFFAADQLCKHKIEQKPDGWEKGAAGGWLTFTKYHNQGIFLNCLEKKEKLVKGMTSLLFVALMAVLGFYSGKTEAGASKRFRLGAAFVAGGAASNLWDRYRLGHVVDYFSFRPLPKIVFNLGDLALFLGNLLILPGICGREKEKRRKG